MDLVRDLLDKKVVDRHGREMGRVDRLVLELRDDAPPRVTAIELGPAVLADRVRPIFGRWMRGLEVALGIDQGRPLRIPFGDMSIEWRPAVVVIRLRPVPSNLICQSCRSSGDGFVDVK